MPLFNWVPPTFSRDKFPAGIILPFLGATTPDNWTDFTAANGKLIVGAGSTYSAGSSAVASGDAISGSLNSGGAHSGGSVIGPNTKTGQSSGVTQYLGNSVVSHIHTISDSFNSTQELARTYKLIKASTGIDVLPPEVVTFGASSLKSPMANIHSTVDRFMQPDTADGVLHAALTISNGFTTSSDGAHRHYSFTDALNVTYDYSPVSINSPSSGAHAHTGSLAGTLNTKYFYLSLWQHATAGCPNQKNMIAMWEGTTAPEGWGLCDGADGRPDLRDYYIRVGSEAQQGSFGGDNICSWEVTGLSSSGDHSHPPTNYGGALTQSYYATYHSNVFGAHTDHTANAISSIVLPAYYALSFIVKL